MITSVENTVHVFPNVYLAQGAVLEDFVVLGKPNDVTKGDPNPTRLGEFALIRSMSVIYEGVTIGARFQCGHHVTVREGTTIGDDVSIGTGCIIEHHVTIEHGVRLHSNVFVPEYSVLREGCWLGPNVVLTNAKYPRSPGVKDTLMGPTIDPGAKIGANATLLPGVTIGRDSLVGAGSVVTCDVAPLAVVWGNPARQTKTLNQLPY